MKQTIEPKSDALIVHAIPGRIRLRILDRKKDVAYFKKLLTTMSDISGVAKLVINPRTASIFIEYDPEATDTLNQFLEANVFFTVSRPDKQKPDVKPKPASIGLGQMFSESGLATKPDIPPAMLMSIGLAGWSCYKLLRGEWKSPAWYVTLWYAYNFYKEGMAELSKSNSSNDIIKESNLSASESQECAN